jgi:hypothetical protein
VAALSLPVQVVIVKHALNIRSTNYIVAEKKVTTEAITHHHHHHMTSDATSAPVLPVSMGALAHGGANSGSAGSLAALGGARRK